MDRAVERVSYTVAEAAIATGLGELTIRRAIQATDPHAFPPPMHGVKRASAVDPRTGDLLNEKAAYVIPAAALRAWVDSLPDA